MMRVSKDGFSDGAAGITDGTIGDADDETDVNVDGCIED